jgi:nucleoside-diphosphate-sugar epimerase
MNNKILVIGGGGYVGTRLVEKLLDKKHLIIVYDLFLYGNQLEKHNNLEVILGDVRDLRKLSSIILDVKTIIHLACISNDPSFDLNPELGKSVNFTYFEDLVKISIDRGVKNFIYASSSSVYGLKQEKNVTEDCKLEPLTDYSLFKVKCEDVLRKYQSNYFNTVIVRPATVCGFSKRQRFDLIVNILTNHAYNNKIIKIMGGSQLRPNINIEDMCDAYISIVDADNELVTGETFNVGFENYSVDQLANIVLQNMKRNDVAIERIETNDIRSYHISSKKILQKLSFKPKKNIDHAVKDLIKAFDKNLFINSMKNDMYFNLKRMKNINFR